MISDDSMKKALQMRRGQGLDISIMLSDPDDQEDNKHTDLAPKGVMRDKPDYEDQDLPPGMDPGYGGLQDQDLMAGMSDDDKTSMAGRLPRSLGERARQEMMSKSLKK
jgi:hypothetical protein